LWVVGGVVLVGVLLVALYPIYSPQNKNTGPLPVQTQPQPNAGTTDLSTMTPREAADRLFDRVMMASESGNTAEVANFLPMAIQAYEIAGPLDLDGRYHLSALQREALDFESALAVAEGALEEYSDHLLNLASAAAASLGLGDTVSARAYYERMLEVWDAEMASTRPDYEMHRNMMPILKASGEALLGR
jgi:tetratricopeptide (TPR) repeat protein